MCECFAYMCVVTAHMYVFTPHLCVFIAHMYVCSTHVFGPCGRQKNRSWELDLDSLQEQRMLFTAELSLQPPKYILTEIELYHFPTFSSLQLLPGTLPPTLSMLPPCGVSATTKARKVRDKKLVQFNMIQEQVLVQISKCTVFWKVVKTMHRPTVFPHFTLLVYNLKENPLKSTL